MERRPGQEPESGQSHYISNPWQVSPADHDALAWGTCVNATHHIAELLSMQKDDAYQHIYTGSWVPKQYRPRSECSDWAYDQYDKAYLRLLRIFDCERHIVNAASKLCDWTMTRYANDDDLHSGLVDHLYNKQKLWLRKIHDWRTGQLIGELRYGDKAMKAKVTKAALAVGAFAVNFVEGRPVDRPGDLQPIGNFNNGDLPH